MKYQENQTTQSMKTFFFKVLILQNQRSPIEAYPPLYSTNLGNVLVNNIETFELLSY